MLNKELNDLRICLRKSKDIVERISVRNVTEKLMEYGINCLPCSCTNDVIELLPSYKYQSDAIGMQFCKETKAQQFLFRCYSNRSLRHLTYDSRGARQSVYVMFLSN